MVNRSGNNQFRFTKHALERLLQRDVTKADVEAIRRQGIAWLGDDGHLHYSIDPSQITWPPDASSNLHRLHNTEVVMSLDGACITVIRRGEDCAS